MASAALLSALVLVSCGSSSKSGSSTSSSTTSTTTSSSSSPVCTSLKQLNTSISTLTNPSTLSGGENVSSIEVEDCLYQHPAVAEACVIGVPDERWGETVKALVVLKPGADASEADLVEHCRASLAHFKCPTSVEFRGEFARTSTGKLQKFKIRAPYWEGRERQVN